MLLGPKMRLWRVSGTLYQGRIGGGSRAAHSGPERRVLMECLGDFGGVPAAVRRFNPRRPVRIMSPPFGGCV
ncbi:hypothetical protein FTUN_3012 [Frigoriglobus tundricola]|uniref:Uncharacterized protein n=1 Tax=Frigoriglobus tundricola TaxID=2774151 RepID=A0A6M5YQ91_9BACT|nr:hypothetical protein FTUN_3012 [Frigoriglobus tundricola]